PRARYAPFQRPSRPWRLAMLDRRDAMLRLGTYGLGALTLPRLLEASTRPAAPRRGKAKSCILVFLWGGPPQQDLSDMKPDPPAPRHPRPSKPPPPARPRMRRFPRGAPPAPPHRQVGHRPLGHPPQQRARGRRLPHADRQAQPGAAGPDQPPQARRFPQRGRYR